VLGHGDDEDESVTEEGDIDIGAEVIELAASEYETCA
jgi:hypothetical protein